MLPIWREVQLLRRSMLRDGSGLCVVFFFLRRGILVIEKLKSLRKHGTTRAPPGGTMMVPSSDVGISRGQSAGASQG